MKIRNLLFILATLTGLIACQKNEDSENLSGYVEKSPSALVANNSSSAGVYKGILVGSSGFFKISVKNGSEDISCNFVFDGKSAILTTNVLKNWKPGEPITQAVFSGTWNAKSVSLIFSCEANGSNPAISVNIPNHVVYASVVKELSTVLVKCYEGTYTVVNSQESYNGIWNFVVEGNNVVGYRSDKKGNENYTGTVSGTTLTVNNKVFTINDTQVTGSFQDKDDLYTITGKRSM